VQEQKFNNEQKADDTTSSQPIAKPLVVRSPKSSNKAVSKIVSVPKFNVDEFEKRMKSYDDLFKILGLDNP
jgi:hypothetical protein